MCDTNKRGRRWVKCISWCTEQRDSKYEYRILEMLSECESHNGHKADISKYPKIQKTEREQKCKTRQNISAC